jgi:hypothetical protein
MEMSLSVPPDGAFECFYRKSDVRRETFLLVRQALTGTSRLFQSSALWLAEHWRDCAPNSRYFLKPVRKYK